MFPCPIYTIIYNSLVGTSREKRTKTIKKRKKDKKRQQLLHTRLVDTWLKKNAERLRLSGSPAREGSLPPLQLTYPQGKAPPPLPPTGKGESPPLCIPHPRGDSPLGDDLNQRAATAHGALMGAKGRRPRKGRMCQGFASCEARFARRQ